jgi:hypothetical protein
MKTPSLDAVETRTAQGSTWTVQQDNRKEWNLYRLVAVEESGQCLWSYEATGYNQAGAWSLRHVI